MINKIFHTKKGRMGLVIAGAVVLIISIIVIMICSSKEASDVTPTDDQNVVEESPESDLEAINSIQGLMGKHFEYNSTLLDDNLSIELIGSYDGLFVEDGSDEVIENALSIVVRNKGSKTLQIGLITMSDGEKTYEFQVSTLPAGTKALVLEKNKAVYEAGKEYDITDFSSGYFASTTLMEESLEISAVDGMITVKNIGNETYSKLYVYYKTKKINGAYMGGITYRTPVENLAPGDSQEVVAAHYKEASGHIIMVEAAVE